MTDKKIEPKRAGTDEPAAGARKAEKTSARRVASRKVARKSARKTSARRVSNKVI
jgi:hypothetical protein